MKKFTYQILFDLLHYMPMNHWLAKTEPDEFGVDDLKRDKKTAWSGVRRLPAASVLEIGWHDARQRLTAQPPLPASTKPGGRT